MTCSIITHPDAHLVNLCECGGVIEWGARPKPRWTGRAVCSKSGRTLSPSRPEPGAYYRDGLGGIEYEQANR